MKPPAAGEEHTGGPLPAGEAAWARAVLAAALFAIDPSRSGLVVRAGAGPVRDRYLAGLRVLLPHGAPWRVVPAGVTDDRLLGGLDLPATLRAGRPVGAAGLLAAAHHGVVVIPGAERLPPGLAGRLGAAFDCGEVVAEREGLSLRAASRFGLVLLDEGREPDEAPPVSLADRLAFRVDLHPVSIRDAATALPSAAEVDEARRMLAEVVDGDATLQALCGVSAVLGIDSGRAWLCAARAARAHAALSCRTEVGEDDVRAAAALVFAHRATRLPPAPAEDAPPAPPPEQDRQQDESERPQDGDRIPEELLVEAVRAAIPPGLLAALKARDLARSAQAGRAGAASRSRLRGRPVGTVQGDPRTGRVALVDTLRNAAPWQPLRRRYGAEGTRRVVVKTDDIRLRRYEERSETTTIFAVDVSGSSALQRLAEAKGAVELLLADCYVRRDKVALVAFRGKGAELVLPPTRSLTRAKRSLAGLPGGGGTPLAAGIDVAADLVDALRRRGTSPVVVLLTDGRANIARDGAPGRPRATEDALESARRLRRSGVPCLLLDTSPQPQPAAARLAEAMAARYLPLPHADSARVSRAVREVLPG
jgi:magnesium chelatase subunit D